MWQLASKRLLQFCRRNKASQIHLVIWDTWWGTKTIWVEPTHVQLTKVSELQLSNVISIWRKVGIRSLRLRCQQEGKRFRGNFWLRLLSFTRSSILRLYLMNVFNLTRTVHRKKTIRALANRDGKLQRNNTSQNVNKLGTISLKGFVWFWSYKAVTNIFALKPESSWSTKTGQYFLDW